MRIRVEIDTVPITNAVENVYQDLANGGDGVNTRWLLYGLTILFRSISQDLSARMDTVIATAGTPYGKVQAQLLKKEWYAWVRENRETETNNERED